MTNCCIPSLKESFSYSFNSPSCIKSQFLWFNKEIKIDNKPFCFKDVSEKNINFITQLYKPDGKLKQWENVKQEFNLNDSAFYKWVQIVHAIPNTWKNIISNESLSNSNVYTNHHSIAICECLEHRAVAGN